MISIPELNKLTAFVDARAMQPILQEQAAHVLAHLHTAPEETCALFGFCRGEVLYAVHSYFMHHKEPAYLLDRVGKRRLDMLTHRDAFVPFL